MTSYPAVNTHTESYNFHKNIYTFHSISTVCVIITARKRSLGQGNIFTGACLSTVGGGGLPDRDPPGQRPPKQRPPRQSPPQTETPLTRDRPGQIPSGQRSPWTDIPQDRDLPDRDPRTVKSRRYASYWNAFLFPMLSLFTIST